MEQNTIETCGSEYLPMHKTMSIVAQELGAGWVYMYEHAGNIQGKDFTLCYRNAYPSKSRIEIRISLPKFVNEVTNRYTASDFLRNGEILSLTVSGDKSPQQVAKDITRKILANARTAYKLARVRNIELVDAANAQQATADAITAAYPDITKDRHTTDQMSGRFGESGYINIRLAYGGGASNVEFRCGLDEARLLALIKTLASMEEA